MTRRPTEARARANRATQARLRRAVQIVKDEHPDVWASAFAQARKELDDE